MKLHTTWGTWISEGQLSSLLVLGGNSSSNVCVATSSALVTLSVGLYQNPLAETSCIHEATRHKTTVEHLQIPRDETNSKIWTVGSFSKQPMGFSFFKLQAWEVSELSMT